MEMMMKRQAVKIWLKGIEGATSIEYALIAVGIAVAIVVIVFTIGADTRDHMFTPVEAVLK